MEGRKKPVAKLVRREFDTVPSPATTRSQSLGKRSTKSPTPSSSGSQILEDLVAPKRLKKTNMSEDMEATQGEGEVQSWADALEALDNEQDQENDPFPPYEPEDKGQNGQAPPLSFDNMQGMFNHFLNHQTKQMNKRTDLLTNVVKAQGGVVNKVAGQVTNLETTVTGLRSKVAEMEKSNNELKQQFAAVSNQVAQNQMLKEIEKSKLQIIFFNVPYDHKNHKATAKKIKDIIDDCKDNEELSDDIKLTKTWTVTLPNQKKTDPLRMVIAACVSENVRKDLIRQLKTPGKLDKGISCAEVYPKDYRDKARDLNRIGNFVRGMSNNTVKFKVLIEGLELQLRFKFTDDGEYVVQKSWSPPLKGETAKACANHGHPHDPHPFNDGKKGTPMTDSVIKLHLCTLQINSKTKITDALFTDYKKAIEDAWSGKPQKVTRVLQGGGKSIFVSFETRKQVTEAFKSITEDKAKYWDEMGNFYMINFNV